VGVKAPWCPKDGNDRMCAPSLGGRCVCVLSASTTTTDTKQWCASAVRAARVQTNKTRRKKRVQRSGLSVSHNNGNPSQNKGVVRYLYPLYKSQIRTVHHLLEQVYKSFDQSVRHYLSVLNTDADCSL
jgi:hypothetical protein